MKTEYFLLVASWLVTIMMLLKFVPRTRIREAVLAFLFMQSVTWFLGLLVVELDLIRYPVRLLIANKSSFTFDFFIYPSVSVVFNLYFPQNKSRWRKLFHYVGYCAAITAVEVLVEKYTAILDYVHWHWYTTFFSLMATFYLARRFFVWFFRKDSNK